MNATMTVMPVAIRFESQRRSLLLMMRLERIAKRT